MNQIRIIAKKELAAYFKSPIAYIILIITLGVFNAFFFVIIDTNREATLRDMFKLMEFMFVFIVPLLTMKVFAEERQAGTLEFLLTCPVKNSTVVLGKYFGSLAFFTLIVVLSTVYYFIMEYFSAPDRSAVLTGYLGIWLEGALFIAIGMMVSSWTRNQIIAAMGAYAMIFTLYFSVSFINYFDGKAQDLIRSLSFWNHTENLSVGLMATADIVYFLSGIVFCVAVTQWNIERR